MDWLGTIGKIAPTVASAFLGPLGGVAVTAIGELLGISSPTQDKIKAAIESGSLTGEQISAIKQLELKLKAEEQERGFRYTELEFKDRDSARLRDAGLAASGRKNYRADAMFILAVAVIVGLVYAVWTEPGINEFLKGVVTLLLGRFLGYLDNIYNFEFGTTRGSQTKDVTIQSMASK